MTGLFALSSIVFLLGCFGIAEWLYRSYRVDLFRSRLFTVRDNLFDLGAKGRVAFDNSAYCALRSKINGLIRFGDRVSLPWVIALNVAAHRELHEKVAKVDGFAKRWSDGTKTLPPDVFRELEGIEWQINAQVAEQILFATPLLIGGALFLSAWVFALFSVGRRLVRSAKRAFQAWWQPLVDPVAYCEGVRI